MTTVEIRKYSKQLDTLYTTISDGLQNIEDGQSQDPKEDIKLLAPKIKEYFNNIESLKLLIHDLPDVEKRKHRQRFKDYKDKYVSLIARVKEASSSAARQELQGKPGANNAADDEEEEYDPDNETEDKYIAEGDELLDDNQRILKATLARVGEANTLGVNAAVKLQAQNEQLKDMDDKLAQMETSLDVSKKVIRQMTIKVVTDKYLWGLMILLVLGIIAMLLVLQFKK